MPGLKSATPVSRVQLGGLPASPDARPALAPVPAARRCLCRECAVHLKESNVQLCPMCRDPVEAYIMRVF